MHYVTSRNQSVAEARSSFDLCLPVIRNFSLDNDGPSVRLLDKDVRPATLLEDFPDMFRAQRPFASKPEVICFWQS
jgi:hypothetical protein